MGFAAAPNQSAVLKALGDFLTAILPAGTPVLQGQDNRVPEPKAANFVVMTPTMRPRLATNIDDDADVAFTGSIAGDQMTVTAVAFGSLEDGATLYGSGVSAGTEVVDQLSGATGGVGVYEVDPPQTLSSRALAAGGVDVTQKTIIRVQIDVHGPQGGDNAQVIATLFRDPYGVAKFEEIGGAAVPLYCEDPRQLPFTNAEQQIENRWVVETSLQANEVVRVPQQFAGAVDVDLINVDAAYPPS